MKIAVVGTGYVGLVTGAGFSDFGHDVTCVDIDAKRVETLTRGEVPFYEPGLHDLIKRNAGLDRLHFTTSTVDAVAGAEIVFIAVGTPSGEDGSADLNHVLEAAKQIGAALTGFAVIVTKSTVPVGTAAKVRTAVASATTHPFAVASNPEFLKEGDAVNDFLRPARVIVGAEDPQAITVLRELYRGMLRTSDRVQVMDIASAELTKYAANAMLATRISFMNELSRLCEVVGADIESVRKGIGSDPRIGNKFLFAGAGFGGSCLVGSETVVVRRRGTTSLRTLRSLVAAPDGPASVCEHPEELEVLAWPGPGSRPHFLPVQAITRRAYEGELVIVRTKMGRRLACTPDHPFVVTQDGERWETVLAEHLTTDHWLPFAAAPADNAGEKSPTFDVLTGVLAAGVPPEHVIVHLGTEIVRSEQVTTALRSVLRDKNRLSDVRQNGTLRLHEAQQAGLDLEAATIGTSRSGTYVPARIAMTSAFWRVVGLYCAEGWITTDLGRDGAQRMRIAWSFHPRDEEHLVDEIVSYWDSIGIKCSVHSTPTSRKVSVSSRLLATWLTKVLGIGTNCYNQRVPDALWTAPTAAKRAFVSGMWLGDGSWSYVTNRRGAVFEYGTVSKEMADGLLRLLGELGIVASWKIGRPPGSTLDTHFVRVSGAEQVEHVLDWCHPGDADRVALAISRQTKRTAPTGYRMDSQPRMRVVECSRRRFQGSVYSLEVPGAETFVTTAGLITHNCFPKDLRALRHMAQTVDVPLMVVDAVERANERQKHVLGERVLAHFGADLAGKRIALWGLAFKPETDDIRESPALVLLEQLRAAGANVVGYDPAAMANVKAQGIAIELAKDGYTAATGADALVLVTEWHELRDPDLDRLKSLMRTHVLIDGRNVWPAADARAAGFTYYGIGRA